MLRSVSQSIGGVLAAVVAAAGIAAKAQDRQLQPSSSWQMFYDNESCDLSRRFGEGEERLTLYLQQFAPGDSFEARLVGAPLGRERVLRRAEVQFQTQEAYKLTSLRIVKSTDGDPVLLAGVLSLEPWDYVAKQLRPITPVEAAAITNVAFKLPGEPRLVLAIGLFSKVRDAMRSCMDDLVRHWGLDPAAVRDLRSRPVPIASLEWISSHDYPSPLQR